MRLFHYCCSHSAAGIRREQVLKPHRQVVLDDVPVVWLTDLDAAPRAALGLTSVTLRCDRMEFCATVDVDAEPWFVFARRFSRPQRDALEASPGARPMHWFVSLHPVRILSITRGAS